MEAGEGRDAVEAPRAKFFGRGEDALKFFVDAPEPSLRFEAASVLTPEEVFALQETGSKAGRDLRNKDAHEVEHRR